MKKIFIIVPAFNEEGNIVKLLSDLRDIYLPLEKRVIMVDDGSIDNTRLLAENFLSQMNLKIIVHQKNQGIPKTFLDGIKAAASEAEDDDIISIMEADNTSKLALLPKMIEKIKAGNDIVIGSRYVDEGCYKNFPLYRTIGSSIINNAVKALVAIPGVTDYTIFFRSYKASVFKKALAKYGDNFIVTESFAANLEILLKIRPYVKNISECPLVYDYGLKKGKSKMKLFKTLGEYRKLIRKIKKR